MRWALDAQRAMEVWWVSGCDEVTFERFREVRRRHKDVGALAGAPVTCTYIDDLSMIIIASEKYLQN